MRIAVQVVGTQAEGQPQGVRRFTQGLVNALIELGGHEFGVWQRFCPKWAIRPRTHSPSRTSGERLWPFAIGRQRRTRFVFREALLRQRRTPEGAENSGVVTDAGDHGTPSRSSSSSRSYVECELVFTCVTPGITANGPVCLESLPYPTPRLPGSGAVISSPGVA